MLKLLRHSGQLKYGRLLLKYNGVIHFYLRGDIKSFGNILADLLSTIISLLRDARRNKNEQHIRGDTYNDQKNNDKGQFSIGKHAVKFVLFVTRALCTKVHKEF